MFYTCRIINFASVQFIFLAASFNLKDCARKKLELWNFIRQRKTSFLLNFQLDFEAFVRHGKINILASLRTEVLYSLRFVKMFHNYTFMKMPKTVN